MKPESIFNQRKRRLNRSHISTWELVSSLIVLSGLVILVYWVGAQRDNYNPDARDLPEAYLETGLIELTLYKTPTRYRSEDASEEDHPRSGLGLIPSSILQKGWQISSPLREFGSETLFEKINGEADKFMQLGFKHLQFIRIQDRETSAEIGIELFDQGDVKGSLGIFAEYVSPGTKVLSRGNVVYVLNQAGAVARKGRFVARIIGDREAEIIKDKAEEIALALEELPDSASDIPLAYTLLVEKLEINPALISFQSQNVFQFDFARDFWFGSPDSRQTGRVFIHQAPSADEAQALFTRLVAEQQYDYEVVRQTGSLTVMNHLFLKTWFSVGYEGSMLYGIEKMNDLNQAQRLTQQLSDILAYETSSER